MLVHFYGVPPAVFRDMGLRELGVFVAYRASYLEAIQKASGR